MLHTVKFSGLIVNTRLTPRKHNKKICLRGIFMLRFCVRISGVYSNFSVCYTIKQTSDRGNWDEWYLQTTTKRGIKNYGKKKNYHGL